ncbi:MAG TPA: hypothetical protein VHR39_13680 [Propionibacteriaceae bacterium]|nr:hypothetical protein [Propionibacteriaceae bacterium]
MGRAQARSLRQRSEIICVRIGSQYPSDRLHRRMQIDAFDDVVAVEKCSPGQAQQVGQPGVDKNVVNDLRILYFVEKGVETPNPAGVETARLLRARPG